MFNIPTGEFLNSPKEWHAAADGFFRGWWRSCKSHKPKKDAPEPPEKYAKEAHYWKTAFVVGSVAGTLTQIVVVWFVGEVVL